MSMVPDRVPVGQPHILCEQNRYTILDTGQVVSTGLGGQPFAGDALAHALRFHGFPGVVVLARGDHYRGMSLNNPNGNVVHAVKWATGNVQDITIVGDDPNLDTRIGGVSMFDHTGDVRFENLTLMNSGGTFAPFIVNKNGLVGRIRLYDLRFLPQDPTSWAGKGMKWDVRGEGTALQWDLRNLLFHEAIEHCVYVDNHLTDSYFSKLVGGYTGRTFMQITNRVTSGPASQGMLVIEDCIANGVGGQGGSDYTIVGNGEGTIYFIGNKSFGSTQGAFVHWTDVNHGVHLTPNGYSSSRLVINDFEVDSPNADRDHLMISGVEDVWIRDWRITGNKTAIGLDTKYGGPIRNGAVSLATGGRPPSQEPGWNTPVKMKKGVWNGTTYQSNHKMTDQEIDALVSNRG